MSVRLKSYLPVVAFLLSACGPSDSDFEEYSVFRSPAGTYQVAIDLAHSKLAFGPEIIKVYVIDSSNGTRNHIVTTKIANDGGGIDDSNVKASWIQSEIVQLCLSGAEQDDRVLEINVRAGTYSEHKKACS